MKKAGFLAFLVFFGCANLLPGSLVDIYKKGRVRLVPVPEFGAGANWSEFFPVVPESQVSPHVNLAVAPDENVFVTVYIADLRQDQTRGEGLKCIYKFDADGQFIKKFGEKGRHTQYFTSVYRRPEIPSILDDKYLVVSEYDRVGLYDLEGNEVKFMKMDYPVWGSEALKQGVIAIAGYTFASDYSIKQRISLQNAETEAESILTSAISDSSKSWVTIPQAKENTGFITLAHPLAGTRAFIRSNPEGNLVVGFSHQPEIAIYSPEGKEIKKFKLNIQPEEISQKVREEFYRGIEEAGKKYDLPAETVVEKIEKSKSFFPKNMPYYYGLEADSEGNILVFVFAEDGESLLFQVYSPAGEFVCETRLEPGDYKVSFKSNSKKAVFHDGFLYALADKQSGSGPSLQLVKFRLEN